MLRRCRMMSMLSSCVAVCGYPVKLWLVPMMCVRLSCASRVVRMWFATCDHRSLVLVWFSCVVMALLPMMGVRLACLCVCGLPVMACRCSMICVRCSCVVFVRSACCVASCAYNMLVRSSCVGLCALLHLCAVALRLVCDRRARFCMWFSSDVVTRSYDLCAIGMRCVVRLACDVVTCVYAVCGSPCNFCVVIM